MKRALLVGLAKAGHGGPVRAGRYVITHAAPTAVCLLAIAAFLVQRMGTARRAAWQQASDGLDLVQIRPNFYVIAGAGGNIVVQTRTRRRDPGRLGHDRSGGTNVLATIRRLTPLPIRYIINASMNPDHVGGNDKLARAGLSILPGAVAAGAGLDDDLLSNTGTASVPAQRFEQHQAIRSRCPIHWARTCAARHTRRRRPGTPGAACSARGSHQCPTLPASQSLGVGRWHKPAPKAPQWSDCRLAQGITTMHVSACRLSECHSTKMLSFLMNHSARSSSVSSSSRAIPSK